jgi:hypothetical protein
MVTVSTSSPSSLLLAELEGDDGLAPRLERGTNHSLRTAGTGLLPNEDLAPAGALPRFFLVFNSISVGRAMEARDVTG